MADHTTEPTTAELFTRLTEQSRQLVRDEIRLAQAETGAKVKHGVTGAAELGVAGVLALYGLAVLLAAAVLGLAQVVPAWSAALIVAAVVFLVVGVLALRGKREVGEATPVPPEHAVEGVKRDVATLKGGAA